MKYKKSYFMTICHTFIQYTYIGVQYFITEINILHHMYFHDKQEFLEECSSPCCIVWKYIHCMLPLQLIVRFAMTCFFQFEFEI